MYSNEKVKPSCDKFTAYLKKHIKELKTQLEDYEKKANYSEVISELRNNPNLDMVLKERVFLISLNPSFDSQFKLIDFFNNLRKIFLLIFLSVISFLFFVIIVIYYFYNLNWY